jgi:hypothetical protein
MLLSVDAAVCNANGTALIVETTGPGSTEDNEPNATTAVYNNTTKGWADSTWSKSASGKRISVGILVLSAVTVGTLLL